MILEEGIQSYVYQNNTKHHFTSFTRVEFSFQKHLT